MASFLSFVYRRQTSAPLPSTEASRDRQHRISLRSKTAAAPRQFLPPGVTSSGSSESTDWASPGDSSEDEVFLSSPFTPEGLLPRKSADSLRRELRLSPRTLEPAMDKQFSGIAKILAGLETGPVIGYGAPKNHIRRHQDSDEEDDMILPPPVYLQHDGQLTFDSSTKSPMVSTSSCYSRSQPGRPVAMSPVLQVGHARTAVGALVALREAASRNANTVSGNNVEPHQSFESMEQPQKETAMKQQATNKQLFVMGVLPPRKKFPSENQEDDTEDENVPCVAVNTPDRRCINEVQKTASSDDDDDDHYDSPSGFCAQSPEVQQESLSDAARKVWDKSFLSHLDLLEQRNQATYEVEPVQSSITDSAFISQASSKSSLISLGKVEESVVEGGANYDLNEEDFDASLMARKFRNQQLQKQMKQKQEECFEEDFEDEFDDDDSKGGEGELVNSDDHPGSGIVDAYDQDRDGAQEEAYLDFEDALVRRKRRNQRHEKESFLLDVVARLRDNLDLVADIEKAASSTLAAMGSWFIKTPMDEENLMTGFSLEQRTTLLHSIDSILEELQVAQPEEFMLSPSKIRVMLVTHDTLTQALQLCHALITSAIPFAEKNKMVINLTSDHPQFGSQRLFVWKCIPELNCALGFSAPLTPETVRGGGTSVFSLPGESSAETPHTSNVSIGTSITSPYSPQRRRGAPSQSVRPHLILQQDGLQLRHSVEIVSSLLQKLSLACLQLKELHSKQPGTAVTYPCVRACDEIKQIYLDLLAIKSEDARALSNAFYLESQTPHESSCSLPLTREVSADEEDPKVAEKTARLLALVSALAPRFSQHVNPRNYQGADSSMDRLNLFSPSTEDMRSKATNEEYGGAPYEYDDLRRQIGSYDRDEDGCDDEQRDGPCFDNYGSRDSEELEWRRRMYQNVTIAASSLRSLGKQGPLRE